MGFGAEKNPALLHEGQWVWIWGFTLKRTLALLNEGQFCHFKKRGETTGGWDFSLERTKLKELVKL